MDRSEQSLPKGAPVAVKYAPWDLGSCHIFHRQLSHLSSLQLLDLADNSFVGSMPRSLANLTVIMQPKIELNIPGRQLSNSG
jgi:Ran GTPase-activating protein (RanGAP) involved in mRNA processing and transport